MNTDELVTAEEVPILFSKRVPVVTVYRTPEDVAHDQHLSIISRAFILRLLECVTRVVVVPRTDLDTTIDQEGLP